MKPKRIANLNIEEIAVSSDKELLQFLLDRHMRNIGSSIGSVVVAAGVDHEDFVKSVNNWRTKQVSAIEARLLELLVLEEK